MTAALLIPAGARGEAVALEAPPPIPIPPGARCFVWITAPRAERVAQQQCSRHGVPTFLPLRELAANDPKACAPMFPGYLFACAAGILPGITAARGVVSTADGPIIVPPAALAKLLGECDADGIHKRGRLEPPPEPPRYAVGEPVRVIAGPLTGAIATIARVNGAHVRVELHHFLGNAPADLRAEQVERLT
jgi:hypothetical protein